MNVKEGLLLESFLDALRFIKKVDLGISVNDYAANKYFYRDAWEENEDFFRYAYELKEKQLQAAEEKLKLKTQNEVDASVNADCLAGCRVKLQAAEEREKILREAVERWQNYSDGIAWDSGGSHLTEKDVYDMTAKALEKIASNEAGKEQE